MYIRVSFQHMSFSDEIGRIYFKIERSSLTVLPRFYGTLKARLQCSLMALARSLDWNAAQMPLMVDSNCLVHFDESTRIERGKQKAWQ